MVVRMGVDGTVSESCPEAGFGINGVECSGYATRVCYLARIFGPKYDA
jgi:hypothetical protein